jgi:hypothetical protein
MNAEQCHRRAADCAASAALALDEAVSLEFLKLAGQWRAMAVRQMFLGDIADLADRWELLERPRLPAG